MKIFKHDTINIASYFCCALINGDVSGLNDTEYIALNQFEKRFQGFYVMYSSTTGETHFARDAVTGLHADCLEVDIYLQLIHKEGINYLPELFINRVEETETPRTNNISGYGSKLPTSKLVHCADGYKRRVYSRCYGNVASQYIIVQGKEFYL